MRVVVLGFAAWALPTLRACIDDNASLALVTYDDGQVPRRPPFWCSLADYGRECGVTTILDTWPPGYKWRLYPEADVLISSNWRHRIPPHVLARFQSAAFNVHRSLLPEFRGIAPLNRAIASGASRTGVTIHRLTHEFDVGDIVAQEVIPIDDGDTATTIYHRSSQTVYRMTRKVLHSHRRGTLVGRPQCGTCGVDSASSYDLRIDWAEGAEQINNLVRAQSPPFDSAYTYVGVTRIAIERADIVELDDSYPPGLVLAEHNDGSAVVACGSRVAPPRGILVRAARASDARHSQRPATLLPTGAELI